MLEGLDLVSLEDVRDVVESIRRKLRDRVREAYIFGSVVDGSAVRGESDLDLIVVPLGGGAVDLFDLLGDELTRLLDAGVPLDLMVADNETFAPLLDEARRRGIRLI